MTSCCWHSFRAMFIQLHWWYCTWRWCQIGLCDTNTNCYMLFAWRTKQQRFNTVVLTQVIFIAWLFILITLYATGVHMCLPLAYVTLHLRSDQLSLWNWALSWRVIVAFSDSMNSVCLSLSIFKKILLPNSNFKTPSWSDAPLHTARGRDDMLNEWWSAHSWIIPLNSSQSSSYTEHGPKHRMKTSVACHCCFRDILVFVLDMHSLVHLYSHLKDKPRLVLVVSFAKRIKCLGDSVMVLSLMYGRVLDIFDEKKWLIFASLEATEIH